MTNQILPETKDCILMALEIERIALLYLQYQKKVNSHCKAQESRHTQILVEALKASSDRINPQPTIIEINFADAEDRSEVETMTQLLEKHSVKLESRGMGGAKQGGRQGKMKTVIVSNNMTHTTSALINSQKHVAIKSIY